MKTLLTLALVATLAGCSNLPEADAQVRLSAVTGEVGNFISKLVYPAGGTASSCVLSVVGTLPSNIQASMEQGTCRAVINEEKAVDYKDLVP
jgi:hypothetical protein